MLYNFYISIVLLLLTTISILPKGNNALSKTEKKELRDEVKEMFYHAYNSYMDHAYPADELMPLTCKGRYRGTEPSRGDVDDILGNFSLTLVDSFDTLVVLGDVEGFERAVELVIRDVHFDRDIVVSVFETNIRMLGGLLSGHVLADMLQRRGDVLSWYRGELLTMAKDLGYRLLPAFNTTTGIPFPRVNLRHGVKQVNARTGHEKDTCTACAGTMLLEFAALSRLTDEPLFEAKAHKAMDSLWENRHRTSNLVGTVINIHNGEWVRRESGIGAGIDSYYEYLLKAYILLGDDTYLHRFNKHYESIMRYINQGPLMVDVHMHRPTSNSKNFMDSLFAFWPGLQVLKGDIKPAVEIHEMLYQVMQRHNFLPEAFTTDFRVHWAQHPLRPEFIESTYFLYRATGDPHYLQVGKKVVENLNKHARVKCGFAAIKDVTTGKHENQMDSFFLSETFKYLYLLFTEDDDLILNIDDFVFTTEAHLLPLTLSLHEASNHNISVSHSAVFYSQSVSDSEEADDYSHTCPNSAHLYKVPDINTNFAQMFRNPLRNMVESACPKPLGKRPKRLMAAEFMAGNKAQIQQLQAMGIRIITMTDGRVQLLHTASEAASTDDAEEGMQFMQEMIEISKTQAEQTPQETRTVQIISEPHFGHLHFSAGPAQFGYDLNDLPGVTAQVLVADPLRCCTSLNNAESMFGKIAVVERGSCMFIDKGRILETSGALAAIVIDGAVGSSSDTSPLFAMSGDGKNDVQLPMVFLYQKEGSRLLAELERNPELVAYIGKTPLRPDAVLKDLLQRETSEVVKQEPVSLADRMSVAVKRFDEVEDEDEPGVRLTFHDTEDRALFRIVQRPIDQMLEFQFDRQALSLITKKKMSALIEKVVGLIQANINFGTMDITQQSDYLFSLGKLMEASVSDNSETLLKERVQKMLEKELHLKYDDVMATVTQQVSDQDGKRKVTTELLRKSINKLLDNYVEDQLHQVYKEAQEFLHQLGQGSSQCGESGDPATTDTDQGVQTDEQSTAKGPGDEEKLKKSSNTKKIRFETRDGKVRQATWVDMSQVLPSGENEQQQQHYVKPEELQDAYHKMSDAREGRYTLGEGGNDKKVGTKIHRPPEWMILHDDEIFVDAEGLIYANFGWDEDKEKKDKEDKGTQSDQEGDKGEKDVRAEGEEESGGPKTTVQGVLDKEEAMKRAVHSLENEIKYGIYDSRGEEGVGNGRDTGEGDREREREGEQKNYSVEIEESPQQTAREIDKKEEKERNDRREQRQAEEQGDDDTEDVVEEDEEFEMVEEELDEEVYDLEEDRDEDDDGESGGEEFGERGQEVAQGVEVEQDIDGMEQLPVEKNLGDDLVQKVLSHADIAPDTDLLQLKPKTEDTKEQSGVTADLESLIQLLEGGVEGEQGGGRGDSQGEEEERSDSKHLVDSLMDVLTDLQDETETKDDEL